VYIYKTIPGKSHNLDLLIRKEDIHVFTECLQAMEYQPDFGSKDIHTTQKFTAYSLKTKINVDILTDLDANPYTTRYFSLDNKRMWERKEKALYDNITAYKLSNEDELLYMIYHMAFHIKFEIEVKWLFDLYYYLEKYHDSLDKEYLAEAFRKIGFENVLGSVSDLMIWVFGKTYPLLEENAAKPAGLFKRTWLRYYDYPPRLFGKIKFRDNLVHRMSVTLLKLALLQGGEKKMHFVFDRILPTQKRIDFAFRIKVLGKYKIFFWFMQLGFYIFLPVFIILGLLYYLFMSTYVAISLMKWRYVG